MRIVFTLCSNNYLAQAKTLGDSLVTYNPNYRFVIGLVDRKAAEIDYDFFLPHQVIEVETARIPNFDDLCDRYDIIELNTAVKPFFFKYLFQEYPEVQGVLYLDPDMMVFSSLEKIYAELDRHSLVLTPHILSPIPVDGCEPRENVFLTYGTYNLGFIAVANKPEGQRFLDWWGERTFSSGYIKTEEGMFVDQLWLNLAPVFFADVKVSLDPGLNVAYWNLHERNIGRKNAAFFINEHFPLVFYHFSSFKLADPSCMSSHQNRYTFETRPDVAELFDSYWNSVINNRYDYFSKIECSYIQRKAQHIDEMQDLEPASSQQAFRQLKKITPNFIKDMILSMIKRIELLRDY
ncbi:MAG: glycosyl transferase [Pyrinomonadaceae bacterium]